ncbi:hypothetical protein IIC38_17615 [candidate division KSB1 bacterium]|nr:hypothetical protein [candidate division KSB1 bacterium]
MKHLNDEQIQNYLDRNFTDKTQAILEHLKICEYCRTKLEQYREIYGGLKKEINFQLSGDFSESVLAKLPFESESKTSFYWMMVLVFVGMLLGIGSMFFFIDLKPVVDQLLSLKLFESLAPVVTWLQPILSGININLLFFAGFLLILFSLADRIFVQKKLGMHSLK